MALPWVNPTFVFHLFYFVIPSLPTLDWCLYYLLGPFPHNYRVSWFLRCAHHRQAAITIYIVKNGRIFVYRVLRVLVALLPNLTHMGRGLASLVQNTLVNDFSRKLTAVYMVPPYLRMVTNIKRTKGIHSTRWKNAYKRKMITGYIVRCVQRLSNAITISLMSLPTTVIKMLFKIKSQKPWTAD